MLSLLCKILLLKYHTGLFWHVILKDYGAKHTPVLCFVGEWNSCSLGTNFMPHIITVNAGEVFTIRRDNEISHLPDI